MKVISFKADDELSRILSNVRNKSAFIRDALLRAVDQQCPLCAGAGVVFQSDHIKDFLDHHTIEQCADCTHVSIVCKEKVAI